MELPVNWCEWCMDLLCGWNYLYSDVNGACIFCVDGIACKLMCEWNCL